MPALVWLGSVVSAFAYAIIDMVVRKGAINIGLVGVAMALFATALSTVLNVIASAIGNVLPTLGTFSIVPFFLPSNMVVCLTAFITVKLSGTIYMMTMRFIETKIQIVKPT